MLRLQQQTDETVCVAAARLARMNIFLAIFHEELALHSLLPAYDQARCLPYPRADIHDRRLRFVSWVRGQLRCIHRGLQGADGCREVVATAHQQVETARHLTFSHATSADVSAGACGRVYAFEMRLTVSSRVLYLF